MEAEKRCRTCAHWEEDPDFNEGMCSRLTAGNPTESGYQNDHTLLLVSDEITQEEWGQMLTPPNFGCVLHESREAPPSTLEPYDWGPDGPPKTEPFVWPPKGETNG